MVAFEAQGDNGDVKDSSFFRVQFYNCAFISNKIEKQHLCETVVFFE